MPNESPGLRWSYVFGAGVFGIILIAGSWYAGRSSSGLEQQRLAQQVSFLQEDLAELRFSEARPAPTPNSAELVKLRRQVLALEAESAQFRSKLESELASRAKDKTLTEALLMPGTRVETLKPAVGESAQGSGYVVVVPNAGLYLFASNLPKTQQAHEFQIWATAKDAAHILSAGLLKPDDKGTGTLVVDDAAIAANAADFTLTEEPLGGSDSPTGRKILVSDTCLSK